MAVEPPRSEHRLGEPARPAVPARGGAVGHGEPIPDIPDGPPLGPPDLGRLGDPAIPLEAGGAALLRVFQVGNGAEDRHQPGALVLAPDLASDPD